MYQIRIVTENKNKFKTLVKGFEASGSCHIQWHDSVASALGAAADSPPNLLIIDDKVGPQDGLTIAREVIRTNAMLNQAVVSPLSPEDFHQASEGLGIMAHLASDLKEEQAQALIQLLDEMP
jgi:DNA-binding response OmpR family regulator